MVLIFESVVEILTCENSNETTEATEQYFLVVMFIMLYKVVLTFESVGEILKCDHSNESYSEVFPSGVVQRGSKFSVRR